MDRPPAEPSDRFHAFVTAPPPRRFSAWFAAVLALLGLSAIGLAVVARQPVSSVPPAPPIEAAAPTVVAHVPSPSASPAETVPPAPAVLPDSKPVALAIPKIGVRSVLIHVGQSARGGIEMPPPGPTYDDAGWYRHSPTPGSLGPAIIVGHVDSAAAGPSVFFDLGNLRPGDRVVVTRADGSDAVFTVEGIRRFRKDRFPTELVYGNTGHAALRLITCGGPFDTSSGHYEDNIVVFASLDAAGGGSATP
jgi:sortase (surface protein transpeptidase)